MRESSGQSLVVQDTSKMNKQVVLGSTPGISLKESPEPHISSFPAPSKKHAKQPLLTQRRVNPLFIVQGKEDPKVKKLLEVEESSTEPELSKGFADLKKREKEQNDKVIMENEKGFEKAARDYFDKPEERPTPLKVKAPPPAPQIAPTPETAVMKAVTLHPDQINSNQMVQQRRTKKTKNKNKKKQQQPKDKKKGIGKSAHTKKKVKTQRAAKATSKPYLKAKIDKFKLS